MSTIKEIISGILTTILIAISSILPAHNAPKIELGSVTSAVITTSATNGSKSNRDAQGATVWTNVGNMTADDGVFAVNGLGGVSFYASTTAYGFSIPAGQTIRGVLVEVKKKGTNDVPNVTFVFDDSIKLLKAGAVTGATRADLTTRWSATNAYVSYGGPTDLWDATLTVSDVNNSGFGVAFSVDPTPGDLNATASVDAIRMTIYYSDPDGPAKVQVKSQTRVAGKVRIQ